MSVNVSAKQFWGGRLVDTVKRVLKETDLPPSDLKLEISESVILGDIEETAFSAAGASVIGLSGDKIEDYGSPMARARWRPRRELSSRLRR
jgi:EAL domain-containing protein (putative c-di-GMP-specific phosphodiesterase class I)